MLRSFHLFTIILLAPTLSYGAQLDPSPPVAHFASLPKIGQVSLSPDGSKLLILRAVGETYHATTYELATKKNRMVSLLHQVFLKNTHQNILS